MKIRVLNIHIRYFTVYFNIFWTIFFLGPNTLDTDIAIAQTSFSLADLPQSTQNSIKNSNIETADIVEQTRQVSKSKNDRLQNLLKEIDFTQKSVIWLSCKPGGIETNSTFIIQRPTRSQPTKNPLAERAIWQDMRFKTLIENQQFARISQRLTKHLQHGEAQSTYPKMMQATSWLKTEDNKIILTGGIPVERLRGGRTTSKSCNNQ